MSDQSNITDPNQDASRIVRESTPSESLPSDLETAWAEWFKGFKNVDGRDTTLLRAAVAAGLANRGLTMLNLVKIIEEE